MFQHPNIQPRKFQFYVVVDPANKFLVPLATNKTVNDLIEVVKTRLRKKAIRNKSNNNNNNRSSPSPIPIDDGIDNDHDDENKKNISPSPLTTSRINKNNNNNNNDQTQIDIDSLSTMYWVDAQTLSPKHIYVILRGTDKLQKLLNTYKSMVSSQLNKITQFYWFIARSPSQVLNIANLRPMEIRMAPEEIRQKYHRVKSFFSV